MTPEDIGNKSLQSAIEAIRQEARNSALEEAARDVEARWPSLASNIAAAIRALKK